MPLICDKGLTQAVVAANGIVIITQENLSPNRTCAQEKKEVPEK